jgi:hypothetical protein
MLAEVEQKRLERQPVDCYDYRIKGEQGVVGLVQIPYRFPALLPDTIWHAKSVINTH